jgi:hypothetical protein
VDLLSQTRLMRCAAVLAGSLAAVHCDRTPPASARAAVAVDAAPEHIAAGQPFRVGMLTYRIVRASGLRSVRGTPPRAPPAGSVYVLVEFERVWEGANGITAPDGPLELVLPDGRHVGQDLDAISAHILLTNCGDLGPVPLSPGVAARTCEIFVAPESALGALRLQPSAAAHRGLPRPMADLAPVSAIP